MNTDDARRCQHCGKPLGTTVEVASSVMPSEAKIKRMPYREALRTAGRCDPNGILRRAPLERVAAAKGYDWRWIDRKVGMHWEDAVQQMHDWAEELHADDEDES
jgi:hypothetical protein